MSDALDQLETRTSAQREADLLTRLPQLIARAQTASGWARILGGVEASGITSRAALAALPVTRKSDLHSLQSGTPPFGGLTSTAPDGMRHIFMSPGPIFDPEGRSEDWWRFARGLHALGLRSGDLLQNCFSYHFTPAAFMVEGAAAKLGCVVIPAGIGQTEMQVQAMAELKPAAYVGTPSFLKLIIEKARDMGADISATQRALVSAEALPPSLRSWLQDNGVPHVLQMYASADIGNIAYETETDGKVNPGMIVDEDILLEIVRPGTGDPVAPGEVGEVVVTSFNPDYPLIRFATGDLSAVLAGPSPCGRTNLRIKGWMGRADQTAKIKGMFVRPELVADLVDRLDGVDRARVVVDRDGDADRMTVLVEGAMLDADIIARAVQGVLKLKARITCCAQGDIPRDGIVIEDQRDYDT